MLLVQPLRPGVRLHALIDACHSGTAIDLPYIARIRPDGWAFWEVRVLRGCGAAWVRWCVLLPCPTSCWAGLGGAGPACGSHLTRHRWRPPRAGGPACSALPPPCTRLPPLPTLLPCRLPTPQDERLAPRRAQRLGGGTIVAGKMTMPTDFSYVDTQGGEAVMFSGSADDQTSADTAALSGYASTGARAGCVCVGGAVGRRSERGWRMQGPLCACAHTPTHPPTHPPTYPPAHPHTPCVQAR